MIDVEKKKIEFPIHFARVRQSQAIFKTRKTIAKLSPRRRHSNPKPVLLCQTWSWIELSNIDSLSLTLGSGIENRY